MGFTMRSMGQQRSIFDGNKEACPNKIEEFRLIASDDHNRVMNSLKECIEKWQSKGLSCEVNYKPTVEHDENDYTIHNIIVIGRK